MKVVFIKAAAAAAALSVTVTGGTAAASEFRVVEELFSGSCLKTSDKGCTVWANHTVTARPGFAFVISGADVHILAAENAKLVRPAPGLATYEGLKTVQTAVGPLSTATRVTYYVEAQSGSGFDGIGRTTAVTAKIVLTEIPVK